MPELKNIDVDFLSVVDAGANGKPVLLAKSESTTTERGENKSMGKRICNRRKSLLQSLTTM